MIVISEKQLTERAAKRDPEAFAQLYDRYVEKIYRYVYFKSGRSEDAQDLTALIFLKAWEAISHYRWEGYPFSAWLYRIAHNQIIDYYRTYLPTDSLDIGRTRETASDPAEAAEQNLTSSRIQAALRHLSENQRQVIVLRFLLGYSTLEVAAIMDKNPEAVRATQSRALRALEPLLRELEPSAERYRAETAASIERDFSFDDK